MSRKASFERNSPSYQRKNNAVDCARPHSGRDRESCKRSPTIIFGSTLSKNRQCRFFFVQPHLPPPDPSRHSTGWVDIACASSSRIRTASRYRPMNPAIETKRHSLRPKKPLHPGHLSPDPSCPSSAHRMKPFKFNILIVQIRDK